MEDLLQQRLRKLAEAVLDAIDAENVPPIENLSISSNEQEERLWCSARRALARRRSRRKMIPEVFASGPAWNILLDLYDMDMRRKRVSVSSACVASGAPPTTALRHIGMLVNEGLVLRTRDLHDARRTYLVMSTEGKDMLAAGLRAEAEAETLVGPQPTRLLFAA